MTGVLEIDGKKFYPIRVAAGEVSYSRDYVTRLAREGKVRASNIGRQWFVDLESLRHYADFAAAEQDIRKKQLSDERKQERLVREAVKNSHDLQNKRARSLSIRAAVTAFMVVVAGSVVGLAGHHLFSYTQPAGQLLAAVQESVNQVETSFAEQTLTSEPSKSVSTLGVVEQGVLLLPTSTSSVEIEQLFSDEVELRELADGSKAVIQVDSKGRIVGEPIPFVRIPTDNGM